MSANGFRYPRPLKSEFQPVITALQRHFTDDELAAALGVVRVSLTRRTALLPVVRLGWLILQIMEKPGQHITMFDLLTLGKFTPAPKPAPDDDYVI